MKFLNRSFISMAIIVSVFMLSCNNEYDHNSTENYDSPAFEVVKLNLNRTQTSRSIQKEEYVLKFKNRDALNTTLHELDNKTEEEKLEWLGKLEGFESLLSIYNQAMEEAANLDFTEEEYKNFKEKYQDYLYFPEYLDDYGAYLPTLDPSNSSIISKNGLVMIGDDVIENEVISSYEDLQKSGQALYSPEVEENEIPLLENEAVSSPFSRSSSEVSAYRAFVSGGWWWNKSKLGGSSYEFVKDWTKVGNGKKIRVTFGRIYRNRWANSSEICWHSEVSFRKKGAFGKWYNYKSESTFFARVYHHDGKVQNMGINISGTSSHDYYWDAHFTEEKNSKKRVYDIITNELVSGNSYFRLYRFPGYSAQISVSYRGMPETMELYHFVEGFWMYTDKKGGIN